MNRSALILAAHGSRVEPAVNALVREYANRLASLALFDEVTAAFHQGEPAFATVLDELTADEVTVVPLMIADGYFSEIVLPRELKKNARYADSCVRQTQPVGTHPGIVPLVAGRVRQRLRENNLEPDSTSLAVVGHGTERHARSRVATIELTDALGGLELCREVLPAFLDEDPGVDTIRNRATQQNIIVVPFLIACGPHATKDIPAGLSLEIPQNASPPFAGRVDDRFIVCDAPIGTDPGFTKILEELAGSQAVAYVETSK